MVTNKNYVMSLYSKTVDYPTVGDVTGLRTVKFWGNNERPFKNWDDLEVNDYLERVVDPLFTSNTDGRNFHHLKGNYGKTKVYDKEFYESLETVTYANGCKYTRKKKK